MPQMDSGKGTGGAVADGRWPGWGTAAVALVVYVAAVAAATWPFFESLTASIPGSMGDPFQHLWIIHWSRACLLEGRAPFFCPDAQFPIGAPLGLFSPMHLQTLLYTALSAVVENEVVLYNGVWLFGMLGAGMGAFLLAWYVHHDRAAAVFSGLAMVVSTPLLMHAQGHLELIHFGAIPVFLVAWLRFVDRPAPGRLAAAAGAYVLVAASAAYYVVLTAVPAAWYVAWRAARAWRRGERGWLRARAVPLVAFAAAVLPVLLVLFSPQIWAAAHGFEVTHHWSQFEWFGAAPWGYVVPTPLHRLGRLGLAGPAGPLGGDGVKGYEVASYLGTVPLGFIAYAAARRVRFDRGSFWWSVFGLLVVLSCGATLRYGSVRVDLPAGWLWSVFPPFRLIRVPARFNLLACMVASLLASAGLRDLLGRLSRGRAQAVWCAAAVLTVADLSVSPFVMSRPPEPPGGYAALDRLAPRRAAVLDAPVVSSASGHPLSAVCAYWHSRRGGRTTAGYSGHANVPFDHLMVHDSPFGARELADPEFLADPERQSFGIVHDVPFLDYAWLYLTARGVDYVVLHHWSGSVHEYLVRYDRVKAAMVVAKVFEDSGTTVYDRARLPRPSHPLAVCGEGWRSRPGWPGPPARVAFPTARVSAYSPGSDRPLTFSLRASSFRAPREVRLLAGDAELARWRVEAGGPQIYASPPFHLPEGIHTLTVASDGAARPRAYTEAFDDRLTPYSLCVTEVRLDSADATAPRLAGRTH